MRLKSINNLENKSIDELISLYKDGYIIDTNHQINNMNEMSSTATPFLLLGGLIIGYYIIKYKIVRPLHYKLESGAAKQAGLDFKAVSYYKM